MSGSPSRAGSWLIWRDGRMRRLDQSWFPGNWDRLRFPAGPRSLPSYRDEGDEASYCSFDTFECRRWRVPVNEPHVFRCRSCGAWRALHPPVEERKKQLLWDIHRRCVPTPLELRYRLVETWHEL